MVSDEDDQKEEAMERRALLVGVDEYDDAEIDNLSGCVSDVKAMAALLARNDNGTPNYDCQLLVHPDEPVTRKILRTAWSDLFSSFDGDLLFYFSGHGTPGRVGGFLVTQDGSEGDLGLPMDELLNLANQSDARSILLILDCCYSGILGNPANQASGGVQQAQLREGLTILAASRPTESAIELAEHGLFTQLVLEALKGGAADVRGLVSAASIYGYVEQFLNAWEQRPLYKSHAARLAPVRRCRPSVADSLLRDLPEFFETAESPHRLDREYEPTEPSARSDKVEIFNKFKALRDARLLVAGEGKDLYYAALEDGHAQLTPLGQFYWRLAAKGRI